VSVKMVIPGNEIFEHQQEILNPEQALRYRLMRDGVTLSYAAVLEMWETDEVFRRFFVSLLAAAPFTAYRWETPAITAKTIDRPFEFVLLNSPRLARAPEKNAFAEHFTSDDVQQGIVVFASLGKDALLVAPSPRGADDVYVHLASFLRGAPQSQREALWQVVGQTVRDQLTDRPTWLSTAGAGVAWLHVRLDSRPQYYGHSAYKAAP